MFSESMMKLAATRLAFTANASVGELSAAITGTTKYPAEVTSFLLGVMPHLVERLIDEKLQAPASGQMKSLFLRAFKDIVKIAVEAAPRPLLSRVAFKVGFEKIFSDEYNRLKPWVDSLFTAAIQQGVDETAYLSHAFLAEVDHATKLGIRNDARMEATYMAMNTMFNTIGAMLD